MANNSPKIALLHHVSGANLGDGASIDAVVQNIKSRWPEAKIFGFTMNPGDTFKRHGIPSYPIRQRTWAFRTGAVNEKAGVRQRLKGTLGRFPAILRLLTVINAVVLRLPVTMIKEIAFLARSFHIIRSFDVLIMCGGGQLIESSGGPWASLGGPWQFPYTVFKWALLARLGGVQCIVLNIGAGPLTTRLGRFFVRSALSSASYTSFRDEESRALVQEIGFKGNTHVFPDSAYLLRFSTREQGASTQGRTTNVGLAPMAFGDPRLSPKHDRSTYVAFIRQLGAFGAYLIAGGFCLTLFCTDISLDPPAIQDVEMVLDSEIGDARSKGSLVRVHQWSTEEVLANMSSLDYVVTCRFHATVFAHMLNIPVLAIGHHPKVTALMRDLGLARYCVDVHDCRPEVLAERFSDLVKNRDEIKSRMADKLDVNRKRLAGQFDELFSAGAYVRGSSGLPPGTSLSQPRRTTVSIQDETGLIVPRVREG